MPEKRRVIFLDIDGVIATNRAIQEYFGKHKKACPPGKDQIDKSCCEILSDIVKNLNADVVISSTWRKREDDMAILHEVLGSYDINIIGATKSTPSNDRGNEIIDYITENKIDPNDILVIDDSLKGLEMFRTRLLRTNWYSGLQRNDVNMANAIINCQFSLPNV